MTLQVDPALSQIQSEDGDFICAFLLRWSLCQCMLATTAADSERTIAIIRIAIHALVVSARVLVCYGVRIVRGLRDSPFCIHYAHRKDEVEKEADGAHLSAWRPATGHT